MNRGNVGTAAGRAPALPDVPELLKHGGARVSLQTAPEEFAAHFVISADEKTGHKGRIGLQQGDRIVGHLGTPGQQKMGRLLDDIRA